MNRQRSIYLDFAAATPLDRAVEAAMQPYLRGSFANPLSRHELGRGAAAAVGRASAGVAEFLGCRVEEVAFTSGATESNSLALQASVLPLIERGLRPHLVVSAVEHPSVADVAAGLARRGARLTAVRANRQGYVSARDVARAVTDQTAIVSVAYVCSETGAIQPIAAIGSQLAKVNARRRARGLPAALLHTDAAQAAEWLPCNVDELGVDLLTLSAHKLYGPKGVGALYVRGGAPARPGTPNVSGIVGMAAALELARGSRHDAEVQRIRSVRDAMRREVSRLGYHVTGEPSRTAPGHLHLRRPSLPADVLLAALDIAGIAASAGSACASGSTAASPVLVGMGWTPRQASEAFRISLGRGTSSAEAAAALAVLRRVAATAS